jgi:hypothetical protein
LLPEKTESGDGTWMCHLDGDNAFAPALKIREDELIAILEKITQKYNDYHSK